MATQTNTLEHHGPCDPLAPLWEQRQCWIREAAYFKAEKRGFAPGRELEDWLTAELEIDERLRLLQEN